MSYVLGAPCYKSLAYTVIQYPSKKLGKQPGVLPFLYTLRLAPSSPNIQPQVQLRLSNPSYVCPFLIKATATAPTEYRILSLSGRQQHSFNCSCSHSLALSMHPGREAQSNLFDCRVPTFKFSMKSHCMQKKKKKVNSLTWHTKPLRSDAYQFCQLVPIPSFPSHPRIRSK